MILCGLRPEIVMDIALRAVTFWNYQITQEKIIQTTLTCTKQQQCKFEQEKKQNLNVYKKANGKHIIKYCYVFITLNVIYSSFKRCRITKT